MNFECRQNNRELWLELIFDLSHIEYQKRVWVEASLPGIVSGFRETTNTYFDNLDLADGYDYFIMEGIVTKQEAEIVIEFHNLLKSYTSQVGKRSLSDRHVIRDPEWIMLTEVALRTWTQLKTAISNKEEHKFMDSLERNFISGQ